MINLENAHTEEIIFDKKTVALRITPAENFALRIDSGNGDFTYSDFAQFPINRAFTDKIEAIPASDVPVENEDVPDSTALSEILEVIDDET